MTGHVMQILDFDQQKFPGQHTGALEDSELYALQVLRAQYPHPVQSCAVDQWTPPLNEVFYVGAFLLRGRGWVRIRRGASYEVSPRGWREMAGSVRPLWPTHH